MIINKISKPAIGMIKTSKCFALFPKELENGNVIWLESYYKVWRYDLGWYRPTNRVRTYTEMWCYQGSVRKNDLKEFINNLPGCNYYKSLPKSFKK